MTETEQTARALVEAIGDDWKRPGVSGMRSCGGNLRKCDLGPWWDRGNGNDTDEPGEWPDLTDDATAGVLVGLLSGPRDIKYDPNHGRHTWHVSDAAGLVYFYGPYLGVAVANALIAMHTTS